MPYVSHLYYEETGRGHPVIFIHCPALSHIYWSPVIHQLRDLCRSIALDIRGHGKSGLGETPWTFADIAGDVCMLTRSLALHKPLLVGYSAGGSIALQAALDEPDLFGGLVLVSTFARCNSLYLAAKARLGLLAVGLGLPKFIGPTVVGTNSVDKAHTKAMLPDARQVHPTALASFFREVLRFDVTRQLPEVRPPTLLVYGADDEPMHRYYRVLQQGLPGARAVLFPGVDHRVPTRRPIQFADTLAAFVASLPP